MGQIDRRTFIKIGSLGAAAAAATGSTPLLTPSDKPSRTEQLRERVLARKNGGEMEYLRANPVITARSLKASEGKGSWRLRRGFLVRDRLSSLVFDIDGQELLAGRLKAGHREGDEAERAEADAYLRQLPGHHGQTGHCELDIVPFLERGVDGIAADIQARCAAADAEGQEACQSFLLALEGFSSMAIRAAETAEAAMDGASPERREELEAIASSCRRIAHAPASSFRDAVQFLWFAVFGVMHGDAPVHLVVPGRIDRTLWAWYEADRASERLSRAEALELIEALYLLINDYVADGLAMSVMVGGRDAQGRDTTNELSYLCLEALRRTRLIYPAVGVCWHEGTPDALVKLAVDLIAEGISTPAFFGDEPIQKGLKALGCPPEDACHYINSTCVEITPSRGSNVWVASPYFSMCGMLLDEIRAQVETESPAPDFESFMACYNERLKTEVAAQAARLNEDRLHRWEYGGKPLQSVFTRDCIARGRDIDRGGARYNWIEGSFVGLANLADSLHVIRNEVYQDKNLTLAELKAVLDADFTDQEPLRRRFLDGHAKYGQDAPEVDALFGHLIDLVQEACASHKMKPDDSPYVPGAFCWIMHEELGRHCGSTPDGRKAGFAFADGCGPAQGRETGGPTAAILSTTSWDHSQMIGGLAFNMKFSKRLFDTPRGADALHDLVLTFLKRGGFETQINVVDGAVLREARERPELHRDLLVRIGGYCDYFTRLRPEMQEEIIQRTEYARF